MSDPDPQILDLGYLRRQTAGDVALENELLRLLVGQCAAFLPLLTLAEDVPTRRDAAHSLRGAAAGLGATRLAASAEAIEKGLEPPVAIERAIAELSRAIERRRGRDAA